MNKRAVNTLASAAGLTMLVGLVSAAACLFSPGQSFWFTAIAGCLLTVPFAMAAWNGSLWKPTDGLATPQPSWRDWVGVFFVDLALSGLFVAIDLVVAHPGFSLVFTLGAVGLTFIALPSAVRAWLLERLGDHE